MEIIHTFFLILTLLAACTGSKYEIPTPVSGDGNPGGKPGEQVVPGDDVPPGSL